MASRVLLIRAVVESARDMSTDQKPLTKVLAGIRDAIFNGDVVNGKVLISNSEAGGQTQFAIPSGMTPLETMGLLQEAIDWCMQFENPDNPPATARRIMRLRVSFQRASI